MCDLLRECLDAGAVGMSTSYVDIEEDFNPVPCRWAEHSELEALCAVLGERGRMLQIVHEFFDAGLTVSRVEMLGKLSREHGIPTTLSPIFHSKAVPDACDQVMDAVEREWAAGGRVWPQVQTRPIDISWTLDQRSIMFLVIPGWWQVLSLPTKEEKLAAFADPHDARGARRARSTCSRTIPNAGLDPSGFVIREVALEREPRPRRSHARRDRRASAASTPADLLVDLSVEEDLGTWFMRADIGHNDADAVGGLLAHPYVHVGASDGGAHVGSFATYGDTGFLDVALRARDRRAAARRGGEEDHVRPGDDLGSARSGACSSEGYIADVAVFDADTLDRGPEVASDDFPGDGIRWIRRSVGMDTVLVGGEVTWSTTEGYVDGARAGGLATR